MALGNNLVVITGGEYHSPGLVHAPATLLLLVGLGAVVLNLGATVLRRKHEAKCEIPLLRGVRNDKRFGKSPMTK